MPDDHNRDSSVVRGIHSSQNVLEMFRRVSHRQSTGEVFHLHIDYKQYSVAGEALFKVDLLCRFSLREKICVLAPRKIRRSHSKKQRSH